jgi:hypothetical protein
MLPARAAKNIYIPAGVLSPAFFMPENGQPGYRTLELCPLSPQKGARLI